MSCRGTHRPLDLERRVLRECDRHRCHPLRQGSRCAALGEGSRRDGVRGVAQEVSAQCRSGQYHCVCGLWPGGDNGGNPAPLRRRSHPRQCLEAGGEPQRLSFAVFPRRHHLQLHPRRLHADEDALHLDLQRQGLGYFGPAGDGIAPPQAAATGQFGPLPASTKRSRRLTSWHVPPNILPALPDETAELLPDRFRRWFAARGWSPREPQLALLAKARDDRSALLIAPTGAGKTLAGFRPTLVELSAASLNLAPLAGRGRLVSEASKPGEGGAGAVVTPQTPPHPTRRATLAAPPSP